MILVSLTLLFNCDDIFKWLILKVEYNFLSQTGIQSIKLSIYLLIYRSIPFVIISSKTALGSSFNSLFIKERMNLTLMRYLFIPWYIHPSIYPSIHPLMYPSMNLSMHTLYASSNTFINLSIHHCPMSIQQSINIYLLNI